MKIQTFEEYLGDKHAENYHGVDDDMPEDFERWLGDLDGDDYIVYAEAWGKYIRKKIEDEVKLEVKLYE